ncbi:MAG TPA: flagellar export chaperone FliS [Sphingobium sp.]
MFGTQGYAAASRRYAAIDAGSKVEGATPHQLVKILYDELLLAIEASALAMRAGDSHKARDKQTRALTMLHALETSLDHEKGGDIATSLAIIYREVRRRVLAAVTDNDPDRAMGAHAIIADIAEAWAKIA